jgi:hypothetical protein
MCDFEAKDDYMQEYGYLLKLCPECDPEGRGQLCDFHFEKFSNPQDYDVNCPLCYDGTGPLCEKHQKDK